MKVLVINSGSSSIKFRLVDVVEESTGDLTAGSALLQGSVKGIGTQASFEVVGEHGDGRSASAEIRDHAQALREIFDRLAGSLNGIAAVGHRVVHGGDRFVESTIIS
ncbi:MAG: acetate kinase, partial [Nitrospiraceae bacterium]